MRMSKLIVLAVALTGCQQQAPVEVEKPTARLPLVDGRPGVAYFTLRSSVSPQRIVGVSSPDVERIELHDMTMADGVMRMGPLIDTSFPAGGALAFEPGGKHAMLFGVAASVKPGGKIRMTFDLDPGPDVTVDVPVETLDADH